MTKTRKAFKRAGRNSGERNDGKGSVRITIYRLNNEGKHAKGNITRSMTVAEAKVSEVAQRVEDELFGS